MTSSLTFLSYIFSTAALLTAFLVISSTNPIHSVFFLILVFCNVAALLFILQVDFLAMLFLVVYVGAIAVLFLFVVMMLNLNLATLHENLLRYFPIALIVGILFLFEAFLIIGDMSPITTQLD
jgi:NADH-quinone oxidoreductase subunit J